MKRAIVISLALGVVGQAAAQEPQFLARFDGGIGVISALNGAGTANPNGTLPDVRQNVVRGVPPAGGPWTIAELKADIDRDGRFRVRGRGLLLAGGNSIGQNGNQSVFASLICEAGEQFVEHNTEFAVPLDANGNFRIDDRLNPVPFECPSPVLLIRSSGNNRPWFAAGISKHGDDE